MIARPRSKEIVLVVILHLLKVVEALMVVFIERGRNHLLLLLVLQILIMKLLQSHLLRLTKPSTKGESILLGRGQRSFKSSKKAERTLLS